jgi:hypothetical protein
VCRQDLSCLFYLLGILGALELEYNDRVLVGVLVYTPIGILDNAETKLAKFFVTIPHAYRMLSACRHVAACRRCCIPRANACVRMRACQLVRANTCVPIVRMRACGSCECVRADSDL